MRSIKIRVSIYSVLFKGLEVVDIGTVPNLCIDTYIYQYKRRASVGSDNLIGADNLNRVKGEGELFSQLGVITHFLVSESVHQTTLGGRRKLLSLFGLVLSFVLSFSLPFSPFLSLSLSFALSLSLSFR